ncbi:MAG: oligosaccharide flippase family protein [Bacteroidales bacterium]|jgi:O-antigen/teichoic acid export membrane protein|nr:oligosaccharide flippase family protein [Bacteroidales bacterium]
MKKKFLTNLILILSLNLLIKPFWILGIDRVVQNIVGAEEYGFYYAVLNLSFIFNIFLDFGLTNFNNRNIAQNHHLLNKYFSGILAMKIMLGILYAIITLAIGFIIGYDAHQMKILYILIFNQVLISFVLYLRSNLSGLHLFKTDSLISVLDRFLMIIFCAIMIWGGFSNFQIDIKWFVYAQTLAYFITAAVAFVIVVSKASFSRLYWNPKFYIVVFRQSIPFAILVLLMSFYNRIDSVMIERLLPGTTGAYQSGIYASAYRLLDASNMIAYLFSVLLLPIFARMIKQKEYVGEIVKLSISLLIIPAAIVAVACLAYRVELMQLMYPIHHSESIIEYQARLAQSSTIFGILMLCFVAISSTYIFGSLLTANGNLKQLNTIAASGMALNILVNLVVIPKFLAVGAAYTSLITQTTTAALQIGLAIYIFKFNFNKKYFLKFIIFGFIAVAFVYLTKNFVENWLIGISIFVVSSIFIAVIFRLINIREMFKIFTLEE